MKLKILKWLDDRAHYQPIFKNIGWLFIDRALRIITGLIVGVWVARYLGPNDYGKLAYVTAVIFIFYSISPLGLDNVVIRDVTKKPRDAAVILGSVLRLRIYTALLCYIFFLALIFFLKKGDFEYMAVSALIGAAIFFQPADTVDLWFQSNLQSRRTVMAKTLAYLISNGIKLLLILANKPIYFFAAVVLLESFLSAVALFISYKKFPTIDKWSVDYQVCIDLFKSGFPFLLSGLFLTVYLQTDKLMLEYYLGSASLGYYAVALSLANVFLFAPMTIFSSVAPKIATTQRADSRDLLFVKLTSLMVWGGGICSLFLYFSSGLIIQHLYGESFIASITLLQILSFTLIPVFISVANDYYSLNRNKGSAVLYRTSMGLLVNISLNFLLIPKFGVVGAAISSLISHIVANTLIYWIVMPGTFQIFSKALFLPIGLLLSINNRGLLK